MTEFSGIGSGEPYPPGGYPPPPPYPGYIAPAAGPRNGLGLASLLTGIVALVATVSVLGGLMLGIVAVGTGVSARRRVKRGEATNGGQAMFGILFGIVATVASGLVFAVLIWGLATDQFNENYQHCLGEQNGHAEYCQQYR
jgi:hypothetical protein